MLRTTNVDEYNSREEYLREPRANWIIGWKFTESKKDPSGDALRRERERERELFDTPSIEPSAPSNKVTSTVLLKHPGSKEASREYRRV